MTKKLYDQFFDEARRLEKAIRRDLEALGYGERDRAGGVRRLEVTNCDLKIVGWRAHAQGRLILRNPPPRKAAGRKRYSMDPKDCWQSSTSRVAT